MNIVEQGIARYIGEEALQYLQGVSIGIGGAGGLGANCAACLVRMGFKRFTLVDYDVVEPSNLNRQFFFADQLGEYKVDALKQNLLRINPDAVITTVCEKLTKERMAEVFVECDCVVEAFDGAASKAAFAETFLNTDKLLVMASGIGGWGQSDAFITRKMRERFYLIGDMESDVAQKPPVASGVNIAAAKQADVVFTYYMDLAEKA